MYIGIMLQIRCSPGSWVCCDYYVHSYYIVLSIVVCKVSCAIQDGISVVLSTAIRFSFFVVLAQA